MMNRIIFSSKWYRIF